MNHRNIKEIQIGANLGMEIAAKQAAPEAIENVAEADIEMAVDTIRRQRAVKPAGIARKVGCTEKHATRVIQELQNRGIVTPDGGIHLDRYDPEAAEKACRQAMQARSKAEPAPVSGDALLVGVQFPMGVRMRPDQQTLLATKAYHGQVVIGPPMRLQGCIAEENFRLNCSALRYYPAKVSPDGLIKPGSLVNYRAGAKACPSCRHEYSPKEVKASKGVCWKTECITARGPLGPAKLEFRLQPNPEPTEEVVREAYAAFLDEPKRLVPPRLWAVYPKDGAPADWTPEADDARAVSLARAHEPHDRVILPIDMAVKANGAGRLIGVTIEAQQGLQFGWMTKEEMLGLGNPYGYKLRLWGSSKYKTRKASFVV